VSDTIARSTVEADRDAERPLPDAARAAYAEHGVLLLRRFAPAEVVARFREKAALLPRAQPDRRATTRWTRQARATSTSTSSTRPPSATTGWAA
jgi:hypothetical protein